jgi:hypothetical protein
VSVLYVYAIVRDPPARLGRGLAREGLRVVRDRRLAAVVGEMAASPAPTPETWRAHDAVVRRLGARCAALLPARFGTLAPDEPSLRAHVRAQATELTEALRLVRGCVQMTLRVFGETTPAATPTRKRTLAADAGPGTRYLMERADEADAAASLPEIQPIRERLGSMVVAERASRHAQSGLLGSAYHLVRRRHVASYRTRVRRAAPALSPMRIHVSGPWAPYAFAP